MAKIERWYQTAFQLQNAGDLDAAEPLYRRVLEKQPRHVEALYLLGSLYAQQGRYDEALPFLGRALALRPHFTEAQNNRAVALKELGRLDEALACYDAALAHRPDYAEAHNNRGMTLQNLGRWEEALESFRQAHAARPGYIEPLNNLGILLKEHGQLAESEAAFRQALSVCPTATDPLNNLGLTLMAQARFEEAIACHDAALALKPDFPQGYNSRGASLVALGRFEEAREGYRRALLLKPDYTDARCNVALSYLSENRIGEALAAFDDVLAQNPDVLSARWNRSLTLLVGGDLARGWAEYECRFRHNRVATHGSPQPLWDGSSLAGRTILVHAEQGLGDTLHFVRYLPLVRAAGGRVLFECPPALHPLIAGCDGIDAPLAPPINGAEHAEAHDVQIPLLSLPGLFGTTEETIPNAVPYVSVPADKAEEWRLRLADISRSLPGNGAGLKVGLVWGGSPNHANDHNRSFPLAEFAPLAAVPGVTFWSLQKGQPASQAADAPCGMTLVDLGPALRDFADTAAAVAQMDLIVSVDTSVVHLAGALGKPVWALLPFCPDWRWQLGREDSPWYPTMRLFRQSRPRQWTPVLRRVGDELARLAGRSVSGEEDAAHLVKLGETHFAAGDGAEARRCFEQALSASPGHARARNNLAVLAFGEHRHDDAILQLNAILAQHPGQVSALENLARCWEAKDDDAQALAWWQRALESAPQSPALWNALAQCCVRRQEWAAAQDAFRQSLRLDTSQDAIREILAQLDGVTEPETPRAEVLGCGGEDCPPSRAQDEAPSSDSSPAKAGSLPFAAQDFSPGVSGDTPLVSIITPCYKQAHLLPEAVASVVAQTYPHWEMIIVNDGSPDDTQAVAQSLIAAHPDRIIRLIEKENGGLSAARNTSIEAAAGAFILPLDADDALHPEMVEKTVRALQHDPGCSVAFTHIQHFGTRHDTWVCGPFTLEQERSDNNIPYCSLMRRGLVEALGGYAADVAAYEDWDFWLRALTQGHRGVLVPEPLFRYRKSPTSKLQADNRQREFFVASLILRHPGIYSPERTAWAEGVLRARTAKRERRPASGGAMPGRDGRPRVLIAVDFFFPSIGGGERLAEDIGVALLQAGCEVEVLTRPLPDRTEDTRRGMRVHCYQEDPAQALGAMARSGRFTAVIVPTSPHSRFMAGAAQWDAPETDLILVPCINADGYRFLTERPAEMAKMRAALGNARVGVCSSLNGVDARLLSEQGFESVYVPNAVHPVEPAGDFRREYGLPADEPLLLVVGNCWPEKNHAGLLNLLRDRPGDWRLVLIGHAATDFPHVATHVAQLAALDARVTRIPGAPPAVVSAAMEQADLLLLPSLADATPLVLLEAMSHRLPWLATPSCGSAHDHAGGLLLSVEQFPAAIDHLLARPDQRRALGDAGHHHWRTCYTWDAVGPRYAALVTGADTLPPLTAPAEALAATREVAAGLQGAQESSPAAGPDAQAPAISVILRAPRESPPLRRTLAALAGQSLPAWAYEVVVVEDGPRPALRPFWAKAPSPGVVRERAAQTGLAAARNAGLLRARGELVLFLDDAAAAAPDFLERHLRAHQAHPATHTAVLSGLTHPAPDGESVTARLIGTTPDLGIREDAPSGAGLRDYSHFRAHGTSVKRALLRQYGLFDTSAPDAAADAELAWRLRDAGLQVIDGPTMVEQAGPHTWAEFCRCQTEQGRAAAWLCRRHAHPQIPFRLGVANAHTRLPEIAPAWQKAPGVADTLRTLEKTGWAALGRTPDWADTTWPALQSLRGLAAEFHRLSGYVQALDEYEAQERTSPVPVAGTPLVSVVVTCYNYGRYLAEAVESVVAQTYPHWEMIIVNDGSPDDTQAVAQSLIAAHPDRAIRLITQPNSGHAAHARNRGLSEAQGQYLLCLDADDILASTFLAESVALLQANPRLSIAYTDQERFYGDGTVERFYAGDYSVPHLTQYLPFGACSLFRRGAWNEAGPFRPVGYEDWDFWLSCAERGHVGRRIPKPLFRYRKHNEGKYAQDVARGRTHKAWLVHNHPALFDDVAQRWARGIVVADRWLGGAPTPAPTALVSVLATTVDGDAQGLSRALDGLDGQSHRNWELVLIQRGDGDPRPALRRLPPDARVTLVRAPQGIPDGEAWNIALRAATGRYVAYLPAGVEWRPDHLAAATGFLESTGERAAYTDTVGAEAPHFDYRQILVANLVPPGAMVHEKACLDRSGPFDPSLPALTDWDLWIRLSRFFDIVHLPQATLSAQAPVVSAPTELRALEVIYERYRAAAQADPPIAAAQQDVLRQVRERADRDAAFEADLADAERRFSVGDTDGARARLHQLLGHAPGDTRVLNDLGVISWQGGAAQEGLQFLLQALQADPDDRPTVLNCADALQSLGLSEDAGLLLEAFVRRHPGDAEAARMWQSLAHTPADLPVAA